MTTYTYLVIQDQFLVKMRITATPQEAQERISKLEHSEKYELFVKVAQQPVLLSRREGPPSLDYQDDFDGPQSFPL